MTTRTYADRAARVKRRRDARSMCEVVARIDAFKECRWGHLDLVNVSVWTDCDGAVVRAAATGLEVSFVLIGGMLYDHDEARCRALAEVLSLMKVRKARFTSTIVREGLAALVAAMPGADFGFFRTPSTVDDTTISLLTSQNDLYLNNTSITDASLPSFARILRPSFGDVYVRGCRLLTPAFGAGFARIMNNSPPRKLFMDNAIMPSKSELLRIKTWCRVFDDSDTLVVSEAEWELVQQLLAFAFVGLRDGDHAVAVRVVRFLTT